MVSPPLTPEGFDKLESVLINPFGGNTLMFGEPWYTYAEILCARNTTRAFNGLQVFSDLGAEYHRLVTEFGIRPKVKS